MMLWVQWYTMIYLLNLQGYFDDIKMHIHLSTIKELQEQLAKIDRPLSDNQFLVYICASLTLDY